MENILSNMRSIFLHSSCI